jgi:hypothetical protein
MHALLTTAPWCPCAAAAAAAAAGCGYLAPDTYNNEDLDKIKGRVDAYITYAATPNAATIAFRCARLAVGVFGRGVCTACSCCAAAVLLGPDTSLHHPRITNTTLA